MHRWLPRIASFIVSITIITVIYWRLNPSRIAGQLHALNPWALIACLAMFVPLISLTAERLRWLAPGNRIRRAECHRLVLVSSVLNIVLPSKFGDFAKAYWMHRRSSLDLSTGLSLVVFERCADMFAVCFLAVVGGLAFDFPARTNVLVVTSGALAVLIGIILLTPAPISVVAKLLSPLVPNRLIPRMRKLVNGWLHMHEHVHGDPWRFITIFCGTIVLWFLHLGQVWIFTLSLGAEVPFGASLTINALGILAGLLPLTIAGVGSRDAALIVLYAGLMSPEKAALVGIFGTFRYFVPAIVGLPFMPGMLRMIPNPRTNKLL